VARRHVLRGWEILAFPGAANSAPVGLQESQTRYPGASLGRARLGPPVVGEGTNLRPAWLCCRGKVDIPLFLGVLVPNCRAAPPRALTVCDCRTADWRGWPTRVPVSRASLPPHGQGQASDGPGRSKKHFRTTVAFDVSVHRSESQLPIGVGGRIPPPSGRDSQNVEVGSAGRVPRGDPGRQACWNGCALDPKGSRSVFLFLAPQGWGGRVEGFEPTAMIGAAGKWPG